MTTTYRQLPLLIVVVAVASLAGIATAATEIRLREQAVASSPVVRLGDVAEVVSPDRVESRRLAALPLMPAPAAGTPRFLRKREVEDLLIAHGQNLAGVRVEGAAQVSITAAVAKIDAGSSGIRQTALTEGRIDRSRIDGEDSSKNDRCKEYRFIIESYLDAKSPQPATWRVTCDIADRYLELLDTAKSLPVCRGGRQPWTGRQRFVVSFETAAGTVHVPVYAEVENLSHSVVMAIRPIAHGEIITAANVEVQYLQSPQGASARRAPVTAVEDVIGMEARQSIPQGQVLFSDQVQAPLMIKRGEIVTVTSQAGGIRVRTTARARKDGAKGELVELESLENRDRYDARVTGPNEAAVFAVALPADTKPAEKLQTAQRPIP